MDNFFSGSSTNTISDAVIENIRTDSSATFVTVTYTACINCQQNNQTIRLVVDNRTIILDERGNTIPVSTLRTGMVINATISSAVTRSIPPQANAFIIRIVSRPFSDNVTIGRIINIDRQNRSFTTVSDSNLSTVIRFNVSNNTLILDRTGRPMSFSRLVPGLRVRVRHASFMTASIPPQTTAFEVRVI